MSDSSSFPATTALFASKTPFAIFTFLFLCQCFIDLGFSISHAIRRPEEITVNGSIQKKHRYASIFYLVYFLTHWADARILQQMSDMTLDEPDLILIMVYVFMRSMVVGAIGSGVMCELNGWWCKSREGVKGTHSPVYWVLVSSGLWGVFWGMAFLLLMLDIIREVCCSFIAVVLGGA
jgi:hypothetical protein